MVEHEKKEHELTAICSIEAEQLRRLAEEEAKHKDPEKENGPLIRTADDQEDLRSRKSGVLRKLAEMNRF